jgi:hypothetical protein
MTPRAAAVVISTGAVACSLAALDGYSEPGPDPGPLPADAASDRGVAEDGGGTGATVLASGLQNPYALAIDATNVYFTTNFPGGAVYRCPKTGCGGAPSEIAGNQGGPHALALAGERLFWANVDEGAVRCRALAAGAQPNVVTASKLAHTLAFTNDRLYFDDGPPLDIIRGYTEWSSDGCVQSSTTASVDGQPSARALVMVGLHAFWIAHGEVRTCELTADCPASGVQSLASAPSARSLAIDAFDVFFTNDDGTIQRVSRAGGQAPVVLASGLTAPLGIAVLGDVFFTTTGSTPMVARVAKNGGPVTVLTRDVKRPLSIAADPTHVYFTDVDDGSVKRVTR